MKFSYNWLKDLLKFKETPKTLADILTMYFAETTIKHRGRRAVLEVDLLSNQVAEASGHFGLAREIGAILGKKFIYPKLSLKEKNLSAKSFLNVEIKSPNCNCYLARLMQGIEVKESPKWLKDSLIDCGLRPINNIVDAANYVMLETGQPLHVFDFHKIYSKSTTSNELIKKTIIIRQAKKDEKITTLENETYDLGINTMVIADDKEPLALAGIKGGKKAGVSKNTFDIVLESANFIGANIRATSKKLGIKTDASWRFEHNLPLELADYAIDRLAGLIQEVAGGNILKNKIGKRISKKEKITIPVKWENWKKFLGLPIEKKQIIHYLSLLGFSFQQKKDCLLVFPPCFRNDIKIEEEVIGEIARLYGINKITPILPQEVLALPLQNVFWEFREKIKDLLRGYDLDEVYNYSFISQKDKEILNKDWQGKLIALDNPISDLFCYLQPTLLLNFLKNIKANFRFVDKLKFFEIGKIYYKNPRFAQNLVSRGVYTEQFGPELTAEEQSEGARNRDIKEKEETVFGGILARKEKILEHPLFYEAKGIIEGLFSNLGIDKDDYSIKPIEKTEYSSILEKGMAFYAKNQLLGVLAMPQKNFFKKYDVEGEVVFWEIKLLALMALEQAEREYEPLPQYPAAIRDVSFIIKKDILIDKILKTIQEAASYLEDADLFDIYEGKNLPSGKQSLSFHLIFRSREKTLTTEEIDKEMKKIYQALQKLGAEIR